MTDIYIPTLRTFENENTFTGSCRTMRFRILPQIVMRSTKEIDAAGSVLLCELWHGPLCYELSEIEKSRSFPVTEAGRNELKVWLEENV